MLGTGPFEIDIVRQWFGTFSCGSYVTSISGLKHPACSKAYWRFDFPFRRTISESLSLSTMIITPTQKPSLLHQLDNRLVLFINIRMDGPALGSIRFGHVECHATVAG